VTAELEALTAALKKSPSPTPQPAPAAKKIKLEDAGGDQASLSVTQECKRLDGPYHMQADGLIYNRQALVPAWFWPEQVLLCDENGCVLLDKKTNKSGGSLQQHQLFSEPPTG
jgi:hypothetical protein